MVNVKSRTSTNDDSFLHGSIDMPVWCRRFGAELGEIDDARTSRERRRRRSLLKRWVASVITKLLDCPEDLLVGDRTTTVTLPPRGPIDVELHARALASGYLVVHAVAGVELAEPKLVRSGQEFARLVERTVTGHTDEPDPAR